MFFKLKQLFHDIDDKHVIIYGTGCYAKEIYGKICNIFSEEIVRAFVVTDSGKQEKFCDKPLYNIRDLRCRYNNEIILVSVSEKYKREIQQNLKRYNFRRVIYLSDYEYRKFNLWSFYKGKSVSEYIECIQDWQLNFTSSSISPYNFIRTEKNENQVVFIIGMEMALPRDIKIIRALKENGYSIVVLCYGDVLGIVVKEELIEYEIEIEQCSYIEELMYKMLEYNPLLYYVEPTWGDSSWADILIQQKGLFGKIVISLYDVFNDGLVFASREQKLMEQFALENADGIVWRWYAKEQLEKQGMKFNGHSIQFLDYCSGKYENDIKDNLYEKSEMLRICFVCGHPNFLFDEYAEQVDGYAVHANIEDILERISGQNCCFHLFAWGLTEQAMKKCKQLEIDNENFKAYFGYEHQKLIDKIKDYDYGCMLFTEGENVPDNISVDGRYFGTVLRDATCNKYFDYLDVGIPVIATLPSKMCDYLEQYGVLVKMNSSNLDIDFLRENRNLYHRKVKENRDKISINYQIWNMIDFFNKVTERDSEIE